MRVTYPNGPVQSRVSPVSSSLLALHGGNVGDWILTDRGWWRMVQNNAITPDGIKYSAASGGADRFWERDLITGTEGATLEPNWYTSSSGDVAASGLAANARIPFNEWLARLGRQPIDGFMNAEMVVDAPDNLTNGELIHVALDGINGASIVINGAKTDTSADLTTVSGGASWDASTRTEGKIKVTGRTWTQGEMAYVVSSSGSVRNGAMTLVAKDLTGGVARVAGGFDPNQFDVYTPVVGDVLRTYTMTRWGSTGGTTVYANIVFNYTGNLFISLNDIDLGNTDAFHELKIRDTGNGLYCNGCILRGADALARNGDGLVINGCKILDMHVEGHIGYMAGCLVLPGTGAGNGMTGRKGGTIDLVYRNIFQTKGLVLGGSSAPGFATSEGPNVLAADYSPGPVLDNGSILEIVGARPWIRDSNSSTYGWLARHGHINSLSAATLPYADGTVPNSGNNAYFLNGLTRTQAQIDAITATAAVVNGVSSVSRYA